MKKTIKTLFVLMAGASLFASCQKENLNKPEESSLVNITITASQDSDTKTVLGEGGKVTWGENEQLSVFQNNGTKISKKQSASGVTADNGETMTFEVAFTTETADNFSYYAFYPNAAYVDTPADIAKTKIELTNNQKPTATSFGPAADILVAKPVSGLSEQPASLDLSFARIVAVGKMTISNLNSAENVQKITFTAPEKAVTGRSYVDLYTATVTEYGYSDQGKDNVVLDYADKTIAANGMTACFTCWPFELVGGDTFSVKVETESKIFTKEVSISDGKSIAFNAGKASVFAVNFNGIEGEEKAGSVDLTYAKLTYEEIKNDGSAGKWGSYDTEYEYTQANGANWVVRAYDGGSYIQLAKAKDKKSYIKLPDFIDSIRKITIEVSGSYSNTLGICTAKDATSADIASDKGDGSKKVFTFDLSGKNVKTAYILSIGGACQGISSIEVWAGEDKRTQLATPGVIAYRSDETPNSIEVTWDAVENAGSYEVTATPASGTPVSETVSEATTYTFTGLAYETEYTVSVVAKPADTSLYKDSAAGVSEAVTTGANPNAGESTSVEIKTFTAINGSIDSIISYACFKGNGTSDPTINNNEIRLYQPSAGKADGGYITISAKEGYTIKNVEIGSSMATKVAYTLGTDTNKSASASISKNGTFEAKDLSTSSISFYCMGSSSSARLYVNYIKVVYE